MWEGLKCVIGGGKLKYRVKGTWVEMKGGGMGPFWGTAHLSPCDTEEQAEMFAKRWAKDECGEYVGQAEPPKC